MKVQLPRRFIRYLVEQIVVIFLYVLTAKLGFLTAIPPGNVTAVWPPSGVALAAVLLLGYRSLSAVWLGSFFVNAAFLTQLPQAHFMAVITASGIATGSTLQAFLGAFLIEHLIGSRRNPLNHARDVFTFFLIAAPSCFVAATFGTTSLCLGGFSVWSKYIHTWGTWWLGDVVGIIVVVPFLLNWSQLKWTAWRYWPITEGIIFYALLFLVGGVVSGFGEPLSVSLSGPSPRTYTLIPFVMWAALRLGQGTVATAILMVSGIAIWGTAHGLGPFAIGPITEAIFTLQAFVAVMGMTGLVLATSVAELKQAEQTAHENEERVRSIIENVIHAVVIMNRKGEIIFWNLQAETIFGWAAREVMGKQMSELIIPPQYREAHKRGLQQFLKTGEGPILNKVIELTALRRGGAEFPIELAVSSNRSKGEYIFSALIRDITERKRAEERIRLVVEAAPNAMIMVDRSGKINLANAQAVTLFGYQREELMGKSVEELLPDRYRSQHLAYRTGFFINPQARAMGAGRDLFGLRKDGREIPIEIGLNPIKTEEGAFVLASIIDITERKRTEEKQTQLMKELESVNRELSDFAYVVSHDLKAPLRGIGSAVEWVATDYRDKLDEKGKEILRLLNQRVNLLHSLVDGILEYSRVGRLKETEVKVDLNQLVKEAIELLTPPKHIRIEIENPLPAVYGEKVRIQQVFQNLLSNAIKYMDKEQGQIKIGCRPADGFWQFHVSDNGPGIEKKYFSKIFQLFQTLQQKEKSESTGIGLALIKKIVDLYQGKIWVESTVGEGSTFYFTLPKSKKGDE